MKIELHYLAPYLPFKLQMMRENGKIYPLTVATLGYRLLDKKPILRPLSDLTKEIEHDGEIFVPLEKLGQEFIGDGFFEDGLFGWGQATGGGDEQDYYLLIETDDNDELCFYVWSGCPREDFSCCTEQNILSYKYVMQLIKWHYDVFGLIEKGLAIDINTIK